MQNEQLDITPTVGLLALLKNMRYTEWYALGEFVDNAIQSYRLNKKVLKKLDPLFKLKIKIDILGSEIQIKDNAAGIGHDRYAAAFETGKPPPDSTGLSEFGVGMKIAACWFADKWKVHTKAIGETAYRLVEFDINKIREKNITNLDVIRAPAKLNSHYTIVTLSKLNHKPRSLTITKIKEHLGSMYRHLVNTNEIDIIVDNKSLRYEKPKIRTSGYYKDWEDGVIKKPKSIKWYKEFSFEFEKMPITGFVAIREKGKVKQPGFSLFRRGRLITGTEDNPFKPEKIFGQSNDRRQQVIFGEVHMDDMPVAFSKNDFVWDEVKKNRFISKLHEEVQFLDKEKKIDFIKQSKHWSEDLERDDIRYESKKGLEQVEKFTARGLEKATLENEKTNSLTKKHEIAKEKEKGREFPVNYLGKEYNVQFTYEYDPNASDLYDIQVSTDKKKIDIFLNLKHTFASRFFTTQNERNGFTIFIAYLAVCEVHLVNKEGVREVTMLRNRLNQICQNIPPRT